MIRLPPPVWLLVYLALCSAVSWALGWPTIPLLPMKSLGLLLIIIGVSLPAWGIFLFRQEQTEVNPTSVANRALVTGGPYRFTRNPMYLGLTIVAVGCVLWIGSWPMVAAPAALFLTANAIHIPFEEAKMRRQFPTEFARYEARVRRWL